MNIRRVVSLSLLISIVPSVAMEQTIKTPAQLVDPNIGGVSLLLSTTRAIVQLPHDYPQITPQLNLGLNDSYLATKIYAFPAGGVSLMPGEGGPITDPDSLASEFDRDFETSTPYFYRVQLDHNIEASYAVGHFAVLYRFQFNGDGVHAVSIEMPHQGSVRMTSSRSVDGMTVVNEVPNYFHLEFSKDVASTFGWKFNGNAEAIDSVEGEKTGLTLIFGEKRPETVFVRCGLSFIGGDQAKKNLDESIDGWNFDKRVSETRSAWDNLLGKIEITGGSEKERIIFYSSLYRAEQNMIDITEDGKYYSGYDHKVHDARGHNFYTDDQLWDTFRCEHPLQLLLDPLQQENIIRSYIRMDQEWGQLPLFPRIDGEFPAMIGQHANALIADAYFKGYRDFDIGEAYEAMKKEAMTATMLPWRNGPMTGLDSIYLEKGFFPALKDGEAESCPEVHPFERRQAVSVTLETAYDDWCLAKVAKELGHEDDYTYFLNRAHNYSKLFNKSIGFMAPRSADGDWVKGFDPILPSGPGGRDYFSECNAWIYTFSVMHDVQGLIDLFGGRKEFLAKLDSLFEVQYGGIWKYSFLAKFPDMTGLIGNYAQGNEPSFHIPYMYDFAGEPWKTQKLVREIMEVWYNDIPLGIPGDDDLGAMGAWYVFSAMGFYPFCPGEPYYVLGSPLFSTSRIRLDNGRTFEIKADNVSRQNKYIQSALLDGKPLHKPWITQQDIERGGTLRLVMGSKPNRSWGNSPADAPPSMTTR